MDSNHRKRKLADLQSAPFGHSGTPPFYFMLYLKTNIVNCSVSKKSCKSMSFFWFVKHLTKKIF
jgi:hypothetical protein